MVVYQLYTKRNGERFVKIAHCFGQNAQRFSAATVVSLVCTAVLLIAGAGGGSVEAQWKQSERIGVPLHRAKAHAQGV